MKADESAQCAGSYESRFGTWLYFFFLGLRYLKTHLKKNGFRLGPDLAILITAGNTTSVPEGLLKTNEPEK
jgi:hypothetical protein